MICFHKSSPNSAGPRARRPLPAPAMSAVVIRVLPDPQSASSPSMAPEIHRGLSSCQVRSFPRGARARGVASASISRPPSEPVRGRAPSQHRYPCADASTLDGPTKGVDFGPSGLMLVNQASAERLIQAFRRIPGGQRRSLGSGQVLYSSTPENQCFLVTSGYVKLVELRADGSQFVRLILGRGSVFGDRPFRGLAFAGFSSDRTELAIAHGPAEVLHVERTEVESAAQGDIALSNQLLASTAALLEFLERRVAWQFTHPVRARVAATLRDLLCFDGQHCRHGHAIDVRLTHQDLSELVGVTRPVVSAELARLKLAGLISYTRSYLCVDDLVALERAAEGHL